MLNILMYLVTLFAAMVITVAVIGALTALFDWFILEPREKRRRGQNNPW